VTAVYPTANSIAAVSAEGYSVDDLPLLRAENAELRTLLTIQGDLSHGATPKEVLQEVVGHVHAALGASRSYALLRETVGERFEPAATAGLDDAAVTALKRFFPGPQPLPAIDNALQTDEPLVVTEPQAAGLLPATLVNDLGMMTLLLVPIRGRARAAIGILLLDFDRPADGASPFTAERVRLAGAVAGQLTLLLENAILYEQLRRRTQRLEALNEIGLALAAAASSEPGALFARLQPRVADVVPGACLLAILDEAKTTGKGRQAATLTAWGVLDEAPLATYGAVPLGTDALSAAIRGTRRVHYDMVEAFDGTAALPPTIAAEFIPEAIGSAVYFPLRLRRRTFGALVVVSSHEHAFSNEQIEFLTTVAAQTAVTLEHGRLYGVLRAKGEVRRRRLDQILQAQEAERKALVDGVLDGALQELASSSYRLDLCIRLSELGRHDRCRDELGQTRRQLAERIEELRTMIGGLRPSNLDLLGLQSVLRDELTAFQQQTGIRTTFQGQFKERLASPVETRAYRMAQELLANVRLHSRAKLVSIELRTLGDDVLLSVTDDGVGFDAEATLRREEGMGLHAVREGAESLGGAAHIQSRPGTGTRIEIVLPRLLRERRGA